MGSGFLALLCLGGPAAAATVRGAVQFPDEVKSGSLRHGAFWRVPNGVLPIGPALSDVRTEAVVVLVPTGAAAGAEADRRLQRADVRLLGLRVSPPVTVVTPGATVTLQNEDRVPHHLVFGAAAPKQTVPPGGRATLTLSKAGDYLLQSEDYTHMSGAILVLERPYFGRVEPGGAFQVEAPEGRYEARLFWRGAWVASAPLEVTAAGAELRLQAALPGAAPAPSSDARPGGGGPS